MRKANAIPLAVLLAMALSGVYGSLHDQLSYTISPEYFTKYKFQQFSLTWAHDTPRLGAAVVGFIGTWWMGGLVGLVLSLCGRCSPDFRTFIKHQIVALGIVLMVAIFIGLAGLALGFMIADGDSIEHFSRWISPGVEERVAFIRVGFLHSSSYLGGIVGLMGGVVFLMNKRSQSGANRDLG
jgi:hypothetical protein